MIPEIRQKFNAEFNIEKYNRFVADVEESAGYPVLFRIAETPVFVPNYLKKRLLAAGNDILDVIMRPDIKDITAGAIPPQLRVPNEDEHPLFICVDFAICRDEKGLLTPQLIEFQGFPSLYGWQAHAAQKYREHFDIPQGFDFFINCNDREEYIELLSKTIFHNSDPNEVILLEIKPEEQKTNIDFYILQKWMGIEPVCLSTIWAEGDRLYYRKKGIKTRIKRIYNRVIFDDLHRQTDFKPGVDLTQPYDVEWAGHPNWFFRLSKYTMPYIRSPYVPETGYLSDFTSIPDDLSQYVLKPLFSFSGQGVLFHVTEKDILDIPETNRKDYILQKKVVYEPVIQAPDGGVKAEIRLLYVWPKGDKRPTLTANLTRLSRGEMIGVRFNENQTWVGSSVSFMEGL